MIFPFNNFDFENDIELRTNSKLKHQILRKWIEYSNQFYIIFIVYALLVWYFTYSHHMMMFEILYINFWILEKSVFYMAYTCCNKKLDLVYHIAKAFHNKKKLDILNSLSV